MLDIAVHGSITVVVLSGLLAIIDTQASDAFVSIFDGPLGRVIDPVFTCVCATPLTALFVGYTGGSLGKWFFGVRVLDLSGETIGFGRAFKRELSVLARGLGFGIPIVCLVTTWTSYKKLTDERATSWDAEMGLRPIHRGRGLAQVTLSTIGVILLVLVVGSLRALAAR